MDTLVFALALSLLHSLWQGTILGAVSVALNARFKRAAPEVRVGTFSLLLFLMFAVWLGTFGTIFSTLSPVRAHPSAVAAGYPPHSEIHGNQFASSMGIPSTLLSDDAYTYLAALWALGVGFLLLRHSFGWVALCRLCRTQSSSCSREWESRATSLAKQMGLNRSFSLRLSERIDVPFVCGLLRPCILLPASILTGLAPRQIEALIAHEMAHLVYHDTLTNLLQIVVETVFFYHPAVRWLSEQIRLAREQRCDDLAVQIIGDRTVYARALYSLEEARCSVSQLSQLAVGAKGNSSMSNASNSHLINRIRRILGVSCPEKRGPHTKATLATGVALFGMAIMGLVMLYPAQATPRWQSKPSTPSDSVVTANHKENKEKVVTIFGDKITIGNVNRAGNNGQEITVTSVKKSLVVGIDADKFEILSGNLNPDTPIKVNGKKQRFGNLSEEDQQQLKKIRMRIRFVHIIRSNGSGKQAVK